MNYFEFIIQDSNGNTLNLTEVMKETMKPSLPSITSEGEYIEKMEEHGTVFRGNGRISKREITLSFDHVEERYIDYEYALNEIAAFFSEPDLDGPYWLINVNREKRAEVMIANFDPKTGEGLEGVIGLGNTLKFNITSALWESSQPLAESFELSSGEIKTISIPRISYPISIELEMSPYGSCPDFAVDFGKMNGTVFQGKQSARFQQNSLSTGESIVMDSVNGVITYKKDGKSYPNNLIHTAGMFLKLKRGENAIRYQGTSTMKFVLKYRTRTAF